MCENVQNTYGTHKHHLTAYILQIRFTTYVSNEKMISTPSLLSANGWDYCMSLLLEVRDGLSGKYSTIFPPGRRGKMGARAEEEGAVHFLCDLSHTSI